MAKSPTTPRVELMESERSTERLFAEEYLASADNILNRPRCETAELSAGAGTTES